MKRNPRIFPILALGTLALGLLPALTAQAPPEKPDPPPVITNSNLDQFKPSESTGMSRALASASNLRFSGPPLDLPADRGAHPSAIRERWSLKGILREPSGRRIPFQITFQNRRQGNSPRSETWSRTGILTARAALLPGAGSPPMSDSRMARLGPAARTSEGRVSLKCDGWSLLDPGDGRLHLDLPLHGGHLILTLAYKGEPLSLPRVAPGDPIQRTLRPQMEVQGRLNMAGHRPLPVTGKGALLQEWGPDLPSAMPGWDTLLTFFEDGRSQLYLGLHSAVKSDPPASLLLEFDAQGWPSQLSQPAPLRPQRTWTSPFSQARYPISVQIPTPLQPLTFEPLNVDQEWRGEWAGALTLWSGAGRVKDPRGIIVGDAFLELAGNAHPVQGRY